MSETFEFLSGGWIAAARAIRDEYQGRISPPAVSVRMNLVISDSPDGEIRAHVDTSEGRTSLELSHVENPDLTITTDYATAKAMFVQADPSAVMAAFMAGKIRIEGDMAKLMMFQASTMTAEPLAAEVADRVKAMTKA